MFEMLEETRWFIFLFRLSTINQQRRRMKQRKMFFLWKRNFFRISDKKRPYRLNELKQKENCQTGFCFERVFVVVFQLVFNVTIGRINEMMLFNGSFYWRWGWRWQWIVGNKKSSVFDQISIGFSWICRWWKCSFRSIDR